MQAWRDTAHRAMRGLAAPDALRDKRRAQGSTGRGTPMTNRIAIALALLILAILVADRIWLGMGLPVLIGRQMNGLIEYLSFWR